MATISIACGEPDRSIGLNANEINDEQITVNAAAVIVTDQWLSINVGHAVDKCVYATEAWRQPDSISKLVPAVSVIFASSSRRLFSSVDFDEMARVSADSALLRGASEEFCALFLSAL